jgi:hypothetical protein
MGQQREKMELRFETGVQSHEVFGVLRHNFFSQRRSRTQKDNSYSSL